METLDFWLLFIFSSLPRIRELQWAKGVQLIGLHPTLPSFTISCTDAGQVTQFFYLLFTYL